MKKIQVVLFVLFCLTVAGLGASPAAEQSDPPLGNFSEIREMAEGSEVRFYMWGGDSRINEWVDQILAPHLEKTANIRLTRVPMDAAVFVNRLLSEKEAQRNTGVMDILWINGENFKNARQGDILYGPFTDALPNFRDFVDPATTLSDAGFPVEGWEAPYGRAQFVFEYDSARVADVPTSFSSLLEWAQKNPGMFTYPQPPDFTGSAFVRQAFYGISGGHEQFGGEFDPALFEEKSSMLWNYLNALEPYLWRGGETYPADLSVLDGLFERGEVSFNMTFTQTAAASKIAQGRYENSVRTTVFENTSLANTHYLAIPFNAPNKAAALVAINEILSPAMQLSKNDPQNWGDFTVLDVDSLPEEYQQAFSELDLGEATLPLSQLSSNAVPEISSEYLEALEKGWMENVLNQ